MGKNDSMQEKREEILYMNYQRVCIMTVIMILCIPFILLRFHLNHTLTNRMMYIIIAYEGCMITFAIMDHMRFILRNKRNLEQYLQIQTLVSILGFTCVGYIDYRVTKSMLFIILTGLCFVFIPIMKRKDRIMILIGQTLIMLVFCIYTRVSYIEVTDLLILQVILSILAAYEHSMMLHFRHITGRLKKSTISSEHDSLTGLLNRRALDARLAFLLPQCVKRSIPLAVIELDIDYFKKYNDAFGHPQGDQCLKKIAQVLYNTLKDTTAIVTRTGGEEFVIVLQDIDKRQLVTLATKIRKNVEKLRMPHAYFGVSNYVTISVGATYGIPTEDLAFDQLYEDADQSLYRAKKNGRNCVAFEGKIYGGMGNELQKKSII